MAVVIAKVPYGGWPNCYRMANGRIELILTADVGPRVIRFGLAGGANEFAEFPEHVGKTGGADWRIYGGHRLWHSPEKKARTYFPDNQPVEVEVISESSIKAVAPPETNCGIRKSLVLTMDADKPKVVVEHRLKNEGVWPVEMAAWCLSVMAPGGVGLAPHPADRDEEGLLPNRVLVLWPYTDMADPRYTWGSGLVRLCQDSARPPTKFGLSVTAGWGAYQNGDRLFLKQFEYDGDTIYPDGGASVEIYANERMLELESLSPLHLVEPGEAIVHIESWTLVDGFVLPADDGEAIRVIEKWLE